MNLALHHGSATRPHRHCASRHPSYAGPPPENHFSPPASDAFRTALLVCRTYCCLISPGRILKPCKDRAVAVGLRGDWTLANGSPSARCTPRGSRGGVFMRSRVCGCDEVLGPLQYSMARARDDDFDSAGNRCRPSDESTLPRCWPSIDCIETVEDGRRCLHPLGQWNMHERCSLHPALPTSDAGG